MNNLLACSLIAAMSIYITGCSSFGSSSSSKSEAKSSSEVDYFTPVKDVSIKLGESMIVHGAMEHCGREARFWSEVSHLLPYSETGFFSNAGTELMKSAKCRELTRVRAVRFTANKVGTESFTVLGDPMNIVVTNGSAINSPGNFLQSGLPNPKVEAVAPEPAKPSRTGSMFSTFSEWIGRDAEK